MSQPPKVEYMNAAQARQKAQLAREVPRRKVLEDVRRCIASAANVGQESARLDMKATLTASDLAWVRERIEQDGFRWKQQTSWAVLLSWGAE